MTTDLLPKHLVIRPKFDAVKRHFLAACHSEDLVCPRVAFSSAAASSAVTAFTLVNHIFSIWNLTVVMILRSCLHVGFLVQITDSHIVLCCRNIVNDCVADEVRITRLTSHIRRPWVFQQLSSAFTGGCHHRFSFHWSVCNPERHTKQPLYCINLGNQAPEW